MDATVVDGGIRWHGVVVAAIAGFGFAFAFADEGRATKIMAGEPIKLPRSSLHSRDADSHEEITMMSGNNCTTLLLLLLQSAMYLIDRADATFGINGGSIGAVPLCYLSSTASGVPSFRSRLVTTTTTTRRRKAADPAAAVGTSPQRHLHNTTLIISKFRGGGGGSGTEEKPDYDDDRTGSRSSAATIAAAENEDFTSRNDFDIGSSDESEDDEISGKVCPEKSDHGESLSLHYLQSKSDNSRIRRCNDTKHPKSKSSKQSINKHFLKFTKQHQLHCYILLSIIAFRSDIFELACRYHVIPTVLDPTTSRRIIKINWSTDVLKLILVVEVVRRYFLPSRVDEDTLDNDGSGGSGDTVETNQNSTQSLDQKQSSTTVSKRNHNPPILPLLLILFSVFFLLPRNLSYFILPMCLRILLTTSGGMPPDPDSPLGKMLLRLFGRGDYYSDLAQRMSYLPPLEQHFTFEQLNERYFRDWGAYRKALATHPMVSAAGASATNTYPWGRGDRSGSNDFTGDGFARGGVASLVSLVTPTSRKLSLPNHTAPSSDSRNAMQSPTTDYYPSKYNNGTVIILDMTKLDTQASRMDSVRDQINFLIHYLAFTEDSSSSHNDQRRGGDISINETNATEPAATVTDNMCVDLMSNITESNSTAAAHEPTVEVIVLLESPGGGVSQYGLAASHLQRLRSNPNVKLTICIDSVAASGGYMMACMSSPGQLFCAPFATVGSIGVIGQSLNVQKTLEGFGIRPFVFRGGKMKNPVGMIGDVTKEGVTAMQLMVDRVHDAFRDHVALARKEAFAKALQSGAISTQTGKYFQPGMSIDDDDSNKELVMDQVATGNVFLGVQAIKFGLVDRLITSDEYISERIRHGARVLKLINHHRTIGLWRFFGPPSLQHRIMSSYLMFGSGGLIDMVQNLVQQATRAFLEGKDNIGSNQPKLSLGII